MTPGEPSTMWGVCACVGRGGRTPPKGGIHLSLPYTSHPSPLGRLAILSIAFLPALAMCTTWNSCLSPASLLLLGALFFVSQYPSGLSRPSLWCSRALILSAAFCPPSLSNLELPTQLLLARVRPRWLLSLRRLLPLSAPRLPAPPPPSLSPRLRRYRRLARPFPAGPRPRRLRPIRGDPAGRTLRC